MAATLAKFERSFLPIPSPTSLRFRNVASLPMASRVRLPSTTSRVLPRGPRPLQSLPVQVQARRAFSHTPRRVRPLWDRQPPSDEEVRRQLQTARPLVTNSGMGRFVRSPSTHTVALLAAAAAVVFYLYNIQTVPVSGRRRFNCYSNSTVEAVGEQQVKHVIYDVERQGGRFLSDWDPRTQMVKRVMRRLIPVSGMEDSNWQVWVIDDPRTCTPP